MLQAAKKEPPKQVPPFGQHLVADCAGSKKTAAQPPSRGEGLPVLALYSYSFKFIHLYSVAKWQKGYSRWPLRPEPAKPVKPVNEKKKARWVAARLCAAKL